MPRLSRTDVLVALIVASLIAFACAVLLLRPSFSSSAKPSAEYAPSVSDVKAVLEEDIWYRGRPIYLTEGLVNEVKGKALHAYGEVANASLPGRLRGLKEACSEAYRRLVEAEEKGDLVEVFEESINLLVKAYSLKPYVEVYCKNRSASLVFDEIAARLRILRGYWHKLRGKALNVTEDPRLPLDLWLACATIEDKMLELDVVLDKSFPSLCRGVEAGFMPPEAVLDRAGMLLAAAELDLAIVEEGVKQVQLRASQRSADNSMAGRIELLRRLQSELLRSSFQLNSLPNTSWAKMIAPTPKYVGEKARALESRGYYALLAAEYSYAILLARAAWKLRATLNPFISAEAKAPSLEEVVKARSEVLKALKSAEDYAERLESIGIERGYVDYLASHCASMALRGDEALAEYFAEGTPGAWRLYGTTAKLYYEASYSMLEELPELVDNVLGLKQG